MGMLNLLLLNSQILLKTAYKIRPVFRSPIFAKIDSVLPEFGTVKKVYATKILGFTQVLRQWVDGFSILYTDGCSQELLDNSIL